MARFPAFLLSQAETLGLDPEKLLVRAGVSRRELRDPDARIQARKNIRLWQAVLEANGDADVGIRIGRELRIKDAGLVGYTMMHSPNLGEALARLVRFGRILSDTHPPTLQLVGDRAELAFEPYPEQRVTLTRLADFDVAAVLAVLREITGVELTPKEIHLPYREPAGGMASHRSFLGGSLRFDQPLIQLVFQRHSLNLPVRTADLALGGYLDQLAQQVVESLAPGGTLAERVERALWLLIKEGRPNLEDVAAELAMSPRTLQRRLREEGTSFVELLDKFRHGFSLLLLEDRELAVYEVAYLLGYAEPSTFYRAFRRWTDLSPQEYRSAKERA